jgi:hypothetical protein
MGEAKQVGDEDLRPELIRLLGRPRSRVTVDDDFIQISTSCRPPHPP